MWHGRSTADRGRGSSSGGSIPDEQTSSSSSGKRRDARPMGYKTSLSTALDDMKQGQCSKASTPTRRVLLSCQRSPVLSSRRAKPAGHSCSGSSCVGAMRRMNAWQWGLPPLLLVLLLTAEAAAAGTGRGCQSCACLQTAHKTDKKRQTERRCPSVSIKCTSTPWQHTPTCCTGDSN